MHGNNGRVKPASVGARHAQQPSVARRGEGEYSHVLVPVNLVAQDRSAILLGLQTAAAHGARLTLLRVLPPTEQTCSLHWLDAIDSLHQRRPPAKPDDAIAAFESSHADIMRYMERYLPAGARGDVDLRTEYRVGDLGSEIASFASATAVDLVILTANLESGWLPVVPAPVRRVLQLTRTRIAWVIPGDCDASPGPNRRVDR